MQHTAICCCGKREGLNRKQVIEQYKFKTAEEILIRITLEKKVWLLESASWHRQGGLKLLHSTVNMFYSQVFVETVSGAEHPEAVEDRPTTEVPGLDLEADLPGPCPLRGLSPAHDTRHVWGPNQGPLPTTSSAKSEGFSVNLKKTTSLKVVVSVWFLTQ